MLLIRLLWYYFSMEIFYLDTNNFSKQTIEEIVRIFPSGSNLEKRRVEFALGRFLVSVAARNFYNLEDIQIAVKNKKPYFVSGGVNFSLSHSKNIVLAAFDSVPTGADVEFMRSRNFEKIFAYYNLHPENIDAETFYRFWTEYEAEIKLQTAPKSRLSLKLLPQFMLSVASPESFDIKTMLKIYELKSPTASTNPSELMSLKLVSARSENETTVVRHEINTASLEFFDPLNLKTE